MPDSVYIKIGNPKEEQYKTYFLNKVDESDLAALVEQGEPAACSCTDKCHAGAVNTSCPLCAVNMTECVGKERSPVAPVESEQPDTDPEPEKESGGNGISTVALAVALAGGGDWLVSWCVGHLAGLVEPAVYDQKYDKWRREDLPIYVENFTPPPEPGQTPPDWEPAPPQEPYGTFQTAENQQSKGNAANHHRERTYQQAQKYDDWYRNFPVVQKNRS